jgi:hypothetical protein
MGRMMGCVYQAKNIVNGKCYIGKTVHSLKHRTKNERICETKMGA